MNSVFLIGRLTRDPEVRYTAATQMAVATFTVAVDRPTRPGAEKQTDFPRVTVFGKQAENCNKYLNKGSMVAVDGRIQTGSYDGKDGKKVYTTDVVVEEQEFCESKSQSNSQPQPTQSNDNSWMNIPDGVEDSLPFN